METQYRNVLGSGVILEGGRCSLGPAQPGAQADAFWETLGRFGHRWALIDEASEQRWSYEALAAEIGIIADILRSDKKKLILLEPRNDFGGIALYLGALLAGHVVLLSDRHSTEGIGLLEKYRPDFLIVRDGEIGHLAGVTSIREWEYHGYRIRKLDAHEREPLHDSLSLLLPTSGSTGSSKVVRLSQRNLAVSACQVCEALDIHGDDVAVAHLPARYVYGLTVINSHLSAGATLVLSQKSVLDQAFWSSAKYWKANSFSGIPWTYRMLSQTGAGRVDICGMNKVFHSGGRLDDKTHDWLVRLSGNLGVKVFFMYGQTESCGRIAVLPPGMAGKPPGAVGMPVKGGSITILETNEVVYAGPNVMLGYAHDRAGLSRGDDLDGILQTGDLGRLDDDGCLNITGRASRFCKINGTRISLDDIETRFEETVECGVVSNDEFLYVFVEGESSSALKRVVAEFAISCLIPAHFFIIRSIPKLPRTSYGKVQHRELALLAAG